MNKCQFEKMIFPRLNNASTYQKNDQKRDNRVMKKIHELANKHEPLLTKKEKFYLRIISFSTSIFHRLPKVHKSRLFNNKIINT